VGFNARGGANDYALVLGRCADAAGSTSWYADPARTIFVGVTAGISFPGNDFAVIRYTNPAVSRPGEVNLGGGRVADMTRAANPVVGQSLCHVGRIAGVRCGTVLSVNNTITYPEGTVFGLFRSNICSEPGELGSPAFSGTTALGMIAGGSGNCSSGGTTYYQPIVEVLSAYGLSIY
jgi:streptogrisin B